jgi:superfamily I DNA/RNA helicase/RecB family exonuclease
MNIGPDGLADPHDPPLDAERGWFSDVPPPPAAASPADTSPLPGVSASSTGTGTVSLMDGSPAELAARLPTGNVLLLGGPGSGKTSLVEAVMHDLAGAPGGTALFVTSSRQAANASTERLLARVERAAGGALSCVTWHAFARGLVTSHADLLPYRGEPRPLSGPEQWSLVRELLLQDRPVVDWGELEPLVRTRAFTDELANFVLACQRRLIGPDELDERADAQRRPAWHLAANFLGSYLGHLALADLVDQAGMVVQAGDLLEDHVDLRADTVAQVGAVLVDEAQELDPAQFRLLELLAAGGARVIMAGDPAGTTDAFRGADPAALPERGARLGATTVLLEHSRRLGGPGLDAVRRLQAAGPQPTVGLRGIRTTAVEAAHFPGPAEEADAIARLLRLAHHRDGVAYGRMAVLLPSPRRLAGPVRRALERRGVPYRLGAGERQLLHEPIVRHLLDLFRLALEPARADELLPSLLTSPLGGLDARELRALRRAALLADRPLARHVAAPPDELGVDPPITARVTALRDLLDKVGHWAAELEADRCFWEVWCFAPAFSKLVSRAERHPEDAGIARQLDALTAFSRTLGLFVDGRPTATMRSYLDVVERANFASDPWLPPSSARLEAVELLSVHGAKGQEFDLVVVAGCLDGVLPRTAWPEGVFEAWRLDGDLNPVARSRTIVESERRRFVLAASRARDRVVFTSSRADGRGEPSRFIAEIGLDASSDSVPGDTAPLGALEAAGVLRRAATDRSRGTGERLAAITTLAAMPRVDPSTWWWRRDWTVDPEPIAAEGRLRTSYSRIGTYEDCHLRYFFSSVVGLDDRTSYQMAFGKLMHTIFELSARGDIEHEPEALKAAFRERFDPAWFPSRAIAHQYWRDGMAMLELWHLGEAERARQALCFEVGFEMEVAGHLVRGRIDRVDRAEGGVVLLDYKTARNPATEDEARRSLQLAIYYLAALRDPELAAFGPPVEMQLVYPAQARMGRFARVSQRPEEDHASLVESRLVPLLEGAAAERFDPSPHADCRFCAFKPICPMWPQGEDFLAPVQPAVAGEASVATAQAGVATAEGPGMTNGSDPTASPETSKPTSACTSPGTSTGAER